MRVAKATLRNHGPFLPDPLTMGGEGEAAVASSNHRDLVLSRLRRPAGRGPASRVRSPQHTLLVVLVGDEKALAMAVKNTKTQRRYSGLLGRLTSEAAATA